LETVKLLPELVPDPIVKPAPAPEFVIVTAPLVFAVKLVVLVARLPMAPLLVAKVNVPPVSVPDDCVIPPLL